MARTNEGRTPSQDVVLEERVQYFCNLSPEKTVEFLQRAYHGWMDRIPEELSAGNKHLADRLSVHASHARIMTESWKKTVATSPKDM